MSFVYGPEHQRIRQNVTLTSNGTIEHKHYLTAPGLTFAVFTSRTGTLNGLPAATTSYFSHDQLGSISAITNEAGAVTERLAYDPWGKRRFINSTPGLADKLDAIVGIKTDRGYTEHEHLDEMGVIHMNGRIFDPLMGRFMSADPIVQAPYNLKSFNRYSYVLNNPLAFTDPTGYEPWATASDGTRTQYISTDSGVTNSYSPGYYSYESGYSGSSGGGVLPMQLAGDDRKGATAVIEYNIDQRLWNWTSFGRTLSPGEIQTAWWCLPCALPPLGGAQKTLSDSVASDSPMYGVRFENKFSELLTSMNQTLNRFIPGAMISAAIAKRQLNVALSENAGGADSPAKTPEDLAKQGTDTGQTDQYGNKIIQLGGGEQGAREAYDSLQPTKVRDINGPKGEVGEVGNLEDGRKATLRPWSSGDKPTVQIGPAPGYKFRF